MCRNNKQSLQLNIEHLKTFSETLVVWIYYEPALIFPYLNQAAYHVTCKQIKNYRVMMANFGYEQMEMCELYKVMAQAIRSETEEDLF